jgi:penicillin-binding protein 2A
MKNKALKIVTITLLSLLLVAVISVVAVILWVTRSSDYVQFDKEKLNDINSQLTVLDNNGDVMDLTLYSERSKIVPIEQLQQHTLDAFVSIEDKRFFEHNGLDFRRIVGAALSNIKSMSFKEGASTISQQLIKNTHLDNSKTIKRKINEMILARELEQNFTKDKILEIYLNTIYFGNNAYGIESASNVFFNKSAKELTLAESATLAGLIKAPNAYSPLTHADKSLQRRNVVLQTMFANGKIDETEYAVARAETLSVDGILAQDLERTYTYGVINEACEILNMSRVQLLNSRLTIHTYFDSTAQNALSDAVINNAVYGEDEKPAKVLAIVSDNVTNGVKAFYSRGQVRLEEKRQIGSTIKPFAVYAPALEAGQISEASQILDEATTFGEYSPKNYNNKYNGWVTIKDAVKNSLNVVSVKVLNNLGVDKSVSYLTRMNFDIDKEQNLSLALGNVNGGVNALELQQAYATLANNGVSNKTAFIRAIDSATSTIYTRRMDNTKVYDSDTAFLVTDMLIETAKSGTAKGIGARYQIAAKTGTVGSAEYNTDALIAGYTTKDTFTVWVTGELLPNSVTGGGKPATIAKDFLDSYYVTSPKNFGIPNGVVKLAVDKVELENNQTLLLANEVTADNEKQSYYFSSKNVPKEYSTRNIAPKFELNLDIYDDKIVIVVPETEYDVKLYRKVDDAENEAVTFDGSTYVEWQLNGGSTYNYYAELYYGNNLTSTSKVYSVAVPEKNERVDKTETTTPKEEKKTNPWWFWFLPTK